VIATGDGGAALVQELISSAGNYDSRTRTLVLPGMTQPRRWGAHDTINVWIPGLFWTPAGTGHLNMAAALGSEISLIFNEVRPPAFPFPFL
jgi:hypothetical protein